MSEQNNGAELRQIVTDALVSMVSGVTGLVPPTGAGQIPDFIQAPIDRAVEKISGSLPVGVPDGWRLVPVKPDIEMVEAGYEASLGQPDRSAHARVIEQYDAMLAAAPTVKSEQVQSADPCGLAPHAQAFNEAPAEALIPSLPAAGSAELPEPDFTLDAGSQPCYYAETVQRIVAALSAQQSAPVTDEPIPLEVIGYASPGQIEILRGLPSTGGMKVKGRQDDRYSEPLVLLSDARSAMLSLAARCQQEGAFKTCLECGYQDGHDDICQFHSSNRKAQQSAPELVSVPVELSAITDRLARFIETVRGCEQLASDYSGSLDGVDEHGGDDHDDPICAVFHRLYYAMFEGDALLSELLALIVSHAEGGKV